MPIPRAARRPRTVALWAPWLLAAVALGACQDLRDYSGTWQGAVATDPTFAHGFAPSARVTADVTNPTRDNIEIALTLPDASPARFVPIRRAAGDTLADVRLPGEPLRTFFGFVTATTAAAVPTAPYLGIVSLYDDNRIELRLIRGTDEAYGLFALRRTPPPPPSSPSPSP